jgi:hypothetical protein
LGAVLSDVLETRVSVRAGRTRAEKTAEFPVVAKKRGGLSVVLPNKESIGIKRSQKELAVATLAVFEAAMRASTATRRKEAFRAALLALLSKW